MECGGTAPLPCDKATKGTWKSFEERGKEAAGVKEDRGKVGRFQSGRADRGSDVGLLGRRWKDVTGRERARRPRDGGRRIDL